MGSDDVSLKVSGNGTDWKEALAVERETGVARFRYGMAHPVSGAPLSNLIFIPGGDGAVSIFRIDAARGQNPRTATISAVPGDVITLSGSVTGQFFDNARTSGVVMVRIWNTSKTASSEPAWVVATRAGSQLRGRDAAGIAGWTNRETVQIGDPVPDVTPTRAIALDISPMLQNVLGVVFPQKGALMKFGSGGAVGMAVSGTAASGSFSGESSLSTGGSNSGIIITSTTTPSPVSVSKLVFVREDDGGNTLGVTLLTMVGDYI